MFKFLLNGIVRDRSRFLFPIIIIATGVTITVLAYCWLIGIGDKMIDDNANFDTGHMKIVTKAYKEMISEKPFDLGLIGTDELMQRINNEFPDVSWEQRIYFGGLLDLPDKNGITKSQGQVYCMAIDLFEDTKEVERMNISRSLVRGRIPNKSEELVISDQVANKMKVDLNDKVTIITSTMFGSMAMKNFTVVGTVTFGLTALDKGAVVLDIHDAQSLLDMENAAGEILGFFKDGKYNAERVMEMKKQFNNPKTTDEFAPTMLDLQDQNDLGFMMAMMDERLGMILFVFIFIMSLVLWNSGLIGGIRRYGEIGVRLAIGESKGHVYRSMIIESIIIGFAGSVIGTIVGVALSYYLQYNGIDISSMMENISMLMNTTMRAKVTGTSFIIGFIPGFCASVIGSCFAGIGIYKRNTAQLFKELET
ncbi:MAG: FtsX-like permease family protein [Candidatus Cloacimonadota bacterium]|nr:FtsX-like permease family protein [Candidatus Cloacimonadota bacterium]